MSLTTLSSQEFYLDMKKSQFKIPIELAKKNFRNIQKLVEKHRVASLKLLASLAKDDLSKKDKLKLCKRLVQSQENFNKKLSLRVSQHNEFISRLVARLERLKLLEQIDGNQNASDFDQQVKDFYKDEIGLLVIDFMLKRSKTEDPLHHLDSNPGVQLAEDLGLSKLIDSDVILQGLSIYNEIRLHKNLKLLATWCVENKKNLNANRQEAELDENLEFETYFQEFIEKVKANDLYGALQISREKLQTYGGEQANFEKLAEGTALLWYNQMQSEVSKLLEDSDRACSAQLNQEQIDSIDFYDTGRQTIDNIRDNVKVYQDLLDDVKWKQLADFFLCNFNMLYGIEQSIPLLNMMSIGGAALKTKSCTLHDSHGSSGFIGDCPVCALDKLMDILPYSHQVKSNIYENPVMLPNGNIYQSSKLLQLNQNMNYSMDGQKPVDQDNTAFEDDSWMKLKGFVIRDPLTSEKYYAEDLEKVFPT